MMIKKRGWSSFDGYYGLHELPIWTDSRKEGEDCLGIIFSHRCVRLCSGDAQDLYNEEYIGTMVYIY